MLVASRKKLGIYGIDTNIRAFGASNTTLSSITYHAKDSGILSSTSYQEGDYVTKGATILQLEKHDMLWATSNISSQQRNLLSLKMPILVEIAGNQGLPIRSKIDFISPVISPKSQTLQIKTSFLNTANRFLPSGQASIYLPRNDVKGKFILPINAVIHDDLGSHVWIQTAKNTFMPRRVNTAGEDHSKVVITKGLIEGEKVVEKGAYLLYSEYRLQHGKMIL